MSHHTPFVRRFRPVLECLEDRTVLTYSAGAVAFDPLLLQSGGAGVFSILSQGDDSTATISLNGNEFNFYGTNHTSLFASSNGLLTFGSANASSMNSDLKFSPTQAAIAPLWSDWYKDSGSEMILGKFDGDRLIIQWNDIFHFDSFSPVTFQTILKLNTGSTPGTITVNYIDVDTGDIYGNGATSTVGIKAAGPQGSDRLLVSFNSLNPLIGNDKAIEFSWVDSNPAPTISFLSPATAFEGSPDLPLIVGGTNFVNGSVVQVNGVALTTTFVSPTELQTTLPASFLLSIGTLSITVANPGESGKVSNPHAFTILDAPLNATGQSFTAIEGNPYTGIVATFIDLNPHSSAGDFTATITWGDGMVTAGTVTADGNGGFNVTGTHTYSLGSYGFTVQITDTIGGASTTAFGVATALDAPITAVGTSFTATAGGGFLGVLATFIDGNPFGQAGDYTATITWGDGAVTEGRIQASATGGFEVASGHTYANPGMYSYTVEITDTIGGATALAGGTAAIRARAATINLDLMPRKNLGKFALSLQYNGLNAESHRVLIDWGDGQTERIKLGTATDGALQLKHQYGLWFLLKNWKRGTDIRVTIIGHDGAVVASNLVHVNFTWPWLNCK